jgi:hypothetical protein
MNSIDTLIQDLVIANRILAKEKLHANAWRARRDRL